MDHRLCIKCNDINAKYIASERDIGRVRETEEDEEGGGEERRGEEKTVLGIQGLFFFSLRLKVLLELHIEQDLLIYN